MIFYTNANIVIHTASLIDIEKCELNKRDAWEINVAAAKKITE